MTAPQPLNPALFVGHKVGNDAPSHVVTSQEPEAHANALIHASEAGMLRQLNIIGPDWFLDMLTQGHLLEELAMSLTIRVQVLQNWLYSKVSYEDVDIARGHGANYYRIKALRVLEVGGPPTDRVALGHMKLLMDAYRDMAEAMTPQVWAKTNQAASSQGIANIVINMQDVSAPGGVTTLSSMDGTMGHGNMLPPSLPTILPPGSYHMQEVSQDVSQHTPEPVPVNTHVYIPPDPYQTPTPHQPHNLSAAEASLSALMQSLNAAEAEAQDQNKKGTPA